jgi:protein-tyrosine phosphatase
MIDVHSHVLPFVDDGARSVEVAIEMCRIAHRDGITHLVATPHANFKYNYDRDAYLARLAELQRQVPEVNLMLGCDLHLSFENFEDAIANPKRYAIGNTRYVLIEFSDFGVPRSILDSLYQMHRAGMVTIVTHPERNLVLRSRFDLLQELASLGSILQITANSLTGFWGEEVRRCAEKMLINGLVRILASDAHDLRRRPPVLSKARATAARMIGAEAANRLVNDYPSRVIADQLIEI